MKWNGGLVLGPMRWFLMAALAMALLGASRGHAGTLGGVGESRGLAGTVGHSRVGMTLAMKSDTDISGGHYFYVHYLKDIPLTGAIQGGQVTLKATDGGTFELHFKGNGSDGGKPLNFANSVGLEGTWKKGSQKLPVTLNFTGMSQGVAEGRRYESVTSESDAAFEAKVQGFWRAVLAGKKPTAALYVSFPLRINQGSKSRTISSAQELTAQWKQIFTPAYLAALRRGVPHDMFTRNGQAMLGDGIAWFDAKGVVALNMP
jgi:hypothetical protein